MEKDVSLLLDGKTLGNLRVVDLKQELDKRGLSKSGSKKNLVKRLKQQLEFEKLCKERKLSGDCDLKKELDAVTEQNEFVQQYLAQQQKIFAEQQEVKRRLELEEIQKSGSEKDTCNSLNENENDEEDEVIVVAEVLAGQDKNGANDHIIIDIASSPPSIEEVQSETEINENPNSIVVTSSLIETSETDPSCGQHQITNMEPATQFPSVPYSLSDIQLPESPESQLPKPQKTVSADVHQQNFHSEKSGSTVKEINSDTETHSNGVYTSSDLTAVNNKNLSSEEHTSEINKVSMSSKMDTDMEYKSSETAVSSERKGNIESDQSDSSDEHSDKNEGSRQKTKDDQDTSSNTAADSEMEHNKDVKDVECDEKRTKDQSEDSENEKSSDSDEYQRRSSKAKDLISNDRAPKRRNRRSHSSTDSHTSQSSESSPEQDSSRDVPVSPKHKNMNLPRGDNSSISISEKSEDGKPRESQRKAEKESTHSGSMPPRQRLKIKRDNVVISEVTRTVDDDPGRTVAAKDPESTNIPSAGKKSITVEPSKEESSDIPDTPSKIPYTPRKVSLSSRKINRKSEEEKKNDDSKPKRSKWGSFGTAPKVSQTISISTDSLKNWFPDFKLINEPVPVNEIVTEEQSPPVREEKSFNNISTDLMDTESSSVKHFAMNRKDMVESELQPSTNEEPVEQGPTSKIIFIQNLVRPFTLHQLKELLKQSGNIVEEQFWIDKIKSKCFVMYESEEDAIKAKNTLNGTRWPSSNPKILSVEFATEDELEFHRRGSEPPKPVPEQLPEKLETYERTVMPVEEHRKKERDRRKERERPKSQQPVREWDKDKILQDSPEREHTVSKETEKVKSSEKKEKKDSKKRPNEDTPAKLLDDLFQKTKSSPCIYWLPLTEEQLKQKEEAKHARRIEREKRNQLEKDDETDRKNKRARSGHRSREMENRRSSTRSRSPISRRR